jgi:hypothetical protein
LNTAFRGLVSPEDGDGASPRNVVFKRVDAAVRPRRLYCTFMTSRSIILRMRNFSDKCFRENQNTHFMFNTFFPANRDIYEIMCKNMLQPDRPQMRV